MKYYEQNSKVIGAVIPSSKDKAHLTNGVILDNDYKLFLPIVNAVVPQVVTDYVFRKAQHEAMEKSTGNGPRFHGFDTYSRDLFMDNWETLSKFDINVGSDIIFLNFTDSPAVVTLSNNEVRVMLSLTCSPSSPYKGKILIFETTPVPLPSTGVSVGFEPSFLSQLSSSLRTKTEEGNNVKLADIYDKARETLNQYDKDCREPNAIKVISLLEIDATSASNCLNGNSPLIIDEYKIVITGGSNGLIKSPYFNGSGLNSGELSKIMGDGYTIAYINDYDSVIGPRFTSTAGVIHEVSRIRNRNIPAGLYVKSYTNGVETVSEFVPLDNIDSNDRIYRSREQACDGMDVLSRTKHESEIGKLRGEQLKIEHAEKVLEQKNVELEQRNVELMIKNRELDLKVEEQDYKFEELKIKYKEMEQRHRELLLKNDEVAFKSDEVVYKHRELERSYVKMDYEEKRRHDEVLERKAVSENNMWNNVIKTIATLATVIVPLFIALKN